MSDEVERPDCTCPTKVTKLAGGGYRVRQGDWTVDVDSQGMIYAPRVIRPDAVDQYVGAVLAAAVIAKQQRPRPRALPIQVAPDDWFRR